jgi:hypothetical protein
MPRQLLNEFDVGDVWGIGPQYKKLLNRHGTNTAWSFQSCRRLGSASICPSSARAGRPPTRQTGMPSFAVKTD